MGNSPKQNKNTTTLLPNEISDFQNLTSFPDEILIKLHNHYKRFSSHINDDGVIDFNEFCEIMNKDKNMSKRIFNAVDINKDGVINFREFLKYLSCFINGNNEEKISISYKLFADEKSKLVTRESMTQLLLDILSEEDQKTREFLSKDEIEYSITKTFEDINRLVSEELEKEKNSKAEEEQKIEELSKKKSNNLLQVDNEGERKKQKKKTTSVRLNRINADTLDFYGYSLFIERNPSILEWLMVDLEKIKNIATDNKKNSNSKKVGCFG